jgi:hypothetical protein
MFEKNTIKGRFNTLSLRDEFLEDFNKNMKKRNRNANLPKK